MPGLAFTIDKASISSKIYKFNARNVKALNGTGHSLARCAAYKERANAQAKSANAHIAFLPPLNKKMIN